MTWTYTNRPATITRDAVRFLVGDTDDTDQQLSDEEISYLLTTEGSDAVRSAVRAARAVAAKYARLVTKSVGDLRISFSDRQKHYLDLATELEQRSSLEFATMFAGGISRDDKETERDREDRVDPSFKRGMHDNPGTSTLDEDEKIVFDTL